MIETQAAAFENAEAAYLADLAELDADPPPPVPGCPECGAPTGARCAAWCPSWSIRSSS